jgi:hypothetical protein
MIGRRREGWSDHALGHDARRALQPRGRIRQVFLAIGADFPFSLDVEQRESVVFF